jgi:hypothetical protein
VEKVTFYNLPELGGTNPFVELIASLANLLKHLKILYPT